MVLPSIFLWQKHFLQSLEKYSKIELFYECGAGLLQDIL
jgi:hypothetical protein